MIDARRTCQLIVGITGAAMSVAAGATAGHMALMGAWIQASVMMCAAAWLLSVSERAIDRMFCRRVRP